MIAVIAGKGVLPITASKRLLEEKRSFFVIALFQETYEEFLRYFDREIRLFFQPHYKLKTLKELLINQKTKEALFIGKVDKKELFSSLSLDWQAIKLLSSLINKSDAAIMERCIAELKQLSISVLKQDSVLNNLRVSPGIITGMITTEIDQDIKLGIETAQQLSELGIGQTIIIKQGVIVAVEALEGTDACITRGVLLGNKGVTICKTAHQKHNSQYDIPTLGSASLAGLLPGDVQAIAWQADRLFIADYQAFIKRAQELGISLIAL